ncbi:aminotransferase class I/II-fold pyridoxal phosphate-dependent enzyme [Paenarthrobacter sp. UW852]|uniref:aminotransferase class I/II-fold pyridoxal phosphate-dependent enzyme n=1 Tax=Paenarthrobacter sp. UW852 TaxID=2951989 RepID=UPI00214995B7|nr:aminotransferase class I/II-fold pyridoxal phosphate-dependent enzyme [Paenarthrobacter sp. UW852]MCR1162801.1 aminotransferase class I/II-fold pyridoxal phosphate-dependent enzyme [Paenarthrobacter sp. UW852]
MSNPSPSLKIGTPSRAWRSRADAWEFLGYALRQLASARHQEPGLLSQIHRSLALLAAVEPYWAEPGVNAVAQLRQLIDDGEPQAALQLLGGLSHLPLASAGETAAVPRAELPDEEVVDQSEPAERPRFEVLVVDTIEPEEAEALKNTMAAQRRPSDAFTYTVNVVPSYEDALVAIMLNPDIQSVVLRPGFSLRSSHLLGSDLRRFLARHTSADLQDSRPIRRILALADAISGLRPELDVYLVAGVSIESLAGSLTRKFRRIFRRQDHLDLHLSLLSGVAERYETPFFTALQDYSRRPASVFHALPISRGASVGTSPWIRDMADFYGTNLLLAETSATSGGLDSLLDPHGSIKRAQELAARAFGAQRTYFVTNGTSTANKIVHQSLLAPGDVVLVDRNCHKSHHYAFVLAGARVSYLDAYPLDKYAFYGAVPLASLKRRLLEYRRAGRLHEVKMVTLTNCTFDGVVYDVERVMEECLAIKPDLVFLWDEAWFAFARSHPVYRRRTGMAAAAALEASFSDPAYAARYAEQAAALHDPVTGEPIDDETWLTTRLIPDPAKARLRVYATQSTHKTLTSLRQGSMIHVFDQDFAGSNRESFREAYMTHTSTSPNYQILASLDIGRRQVELEGFGLVQRQSDLAVSVAQAVARHPLLKKYFRVLSSRDLIGPRYRETGSSMPLRDGLSELEEAWQRDEFVIDPSRLTLDISKTGIDGDTFRHSYLMDDHGIQVNKTSRNTVLFMTNIGTSRSSVAYLIEVLVKLAEGFENPHPSARARTLPASSDAPHPTPPLPDFSTFAARFRTNGSCEDGDIRAAYFESYKLDTTVYLSAAQVAAAVAEGQEVISAGFVTPYPPGFPILVPGQVITRETLEFMAALDTREIHGFDHERGYRVFVEPASFSAAGLLAVAS